MGKANWDRVDEMFPHLATQESRSAYFDRRMAEEPEIMWRLLGDIYGMVQREEERERGIRRMGRRPKPDRVPLDELLRVAIREPYTHDPFPTALARLMGERSQRQFAAKVPCDQSTLSRLLNGQLDPDLTMLERLADAAGVGPWYFPEWRAKWFAQVVEDAYLASPHRSIGMMKALLSRFEQMEQARLMAARQTTSTA